MWLQERVEEPTSRPHQPKDRASRKASLLRMIRGLQSPFHSEGLHGKSKVSARAVCLLLSRSGLPRHIFMFL